MDDPTPPDPDRDRLRALDAALATAPRRRRKTLHLTVRDVKVLEALVARRVETLDGLHAVAFDDVSAKRALNRLGELVSAGYLDRRSVELPGYVNLRSVYFLTARGGAALQLRSDYANEWFATRSWRLDLTEPSIPRQIVTNRVIDWLGGHAIPEHLLPPATRRARGEIGDSRPDAIYQAREPDERGNQLVWLEVDLGHYNRKRIVEKIKTGLEAPGTRFVLLACPTEARQKWLISIIDRDFGHPHWERVDAVTFDEPPAGRVPGIPPDPGVLPTGDVPTMLLDL